jgi:hypothetical protein
LISSTNEILNSNKPNRFWTGLKHLNETNWFNPKNEAINFRSDEKNWWPWLIVDSSTYSQGSCVGKRANALFLEDCYKRMPFACQANGNNQNELEKNPSKQNAKLKCGANSMDFFKQQAVLTATEKMTTSAHNIAFVTDKIIETSYSSNKIVYQNSNTKEVSKEDTNLTFSSVKKSLIDSDSSNFLPF